MRFADFLIEQTKVDFDPTVGTGTGGVDFDVGGDDDHDVLSDVTKRLHRAEKQGPQEVIKVVQALAREGRIDADTIKELQGVQKELYQAYKLIGKALEAAQTGRIKVEKPREGSLYGQDARRRKEGSMATWARNLVSIIANNPRAKEQINQMILAAYRQKKEEARGG